MSLAPFLPLLPDTVVHMPYSTHGAYGAPSYTSSTKQTYPARVLSKRTVVFNAQGEEVVARHVAWVGTTRSIGELDLFGWPTSATTFRIVAVEQPKDQYGIHHNKVFLG